MAMKKYAIWKDKQVIGYIDLTEEQKETLNRTYGIGVFLDPIILLKTKEA